MDYGLAVVTALFTFISPCVLPLLPVYVSYFAAEKGGKMRTFINVIAFCVGISLFFLAIFLTAAFASGTTTFSTFIFDYRDKILVVSGFILILFGLKFMGYLNLPFLDKSISINAKTENVNFINAFVLGLAFSLSMGMCAFGWMSFNLIQVITDSSLMKSILIGVIFTATLDILFIVVALLIDQLKGAIKFIQRHYKIINMISGGLLVVLGILISLGIMDKIMGA